MNCKFVLFICTLCIGIVYSLEWQNFGEIDRIIINDPESRKYLLVDKDEEMISFLSTISRLKNHSQPLDNSQIVRVYRNDTIIATMPWKVIERDSVYESFISKVKNKPNWFHAFIETDAYYNAEFTFESYEKIKNLISEKYTWDFNNSLQTVFPTVFMRSTEKKINNEVQAYNEILKKCKQVKGSHISGIRKMGSVNGINIHKFEISFENISSLGQVLLMIGEMEEFYIDNINIPTYMKIKFWYKKNPGRKSNISGYLKKNGVKYRAIRNVY